MWTEYNHSTEKLLSTEKVSRVIMDIFFCGQYSAVDTSDNKTSVDTLSLWTLFCGQWTLLILNPCGHYSVDSNFFSEPPLPKYFCGQWVAHIRCINPPWDVRWTHQGILLSLRCLYHHGTWYELTKVSFCPWRATCTWYALRPLQVFSVFRFDMIGRWK